MGVFEDVVMKTKSAADYAGKKTGEIIEITKLRISASEIEGRISKELLELGRKVYSCAKEHSDCTEYVESKSESVDKLYAELLKVSDKISELKSEKKCAECGFDNQQDANYCQKCGAKL
jgi:vacuolar-type H+-ATPase subunit I/STV1